MFGLLRGRYSSPIFAIKLGETAIRNCFRDQLSAIRKEGIEYMGDHPCVFTEIGIPYDMDNKHAYKTGDFSNQISALDANHFALEDSSANGYALWVYMVTVGEWGCDSYDLFTDMLQNNHQWGDLWNGEDLSIYSLDDALLSNSSIVRNGDQKLVNRSTVSIDKHSPAFSQSLSSDQTLVSPETLKKTLSTPTISSQRSQSAVDLSNAPGFRAAEAYVRPSPIATIGNVVSYGSDLQNVTFVLTLDCTSAATDAVPTEIFLPEYHFPRDKSEVTVSGGKWMISMDDTDGVIVQKLRWWHGEGSQDLTVKGVVRRSGVLLGKEEEEGYLQQCQQNKCTLM